MGQLFAFGANDSGKLILCTDNIVSSAYFSFIYLTQRRDFLVLLPGPSFSHLAFSVYVTKDSQTEENVGFKIWKDRWTYPPTLLVGRILTTFNARFLGHT